MSYARLYLEEVKKIVDRLDHSAIERMVDSLLELREKEGRLFFLGVGGGAGNSTHAVNDFRKIAGIESYTATDNVSELTARTNDEGWETTFVEWLKGCRLNKNDGVFVFSVGGGDLERKISTNVVRAVEYAQKIGAKVFSIVGRDGGYCARAGGACLIIPTISPERVTPHTESFQSLICHLIVSNPRMQLSKMKWESTCK